ncbi:L-threonine kinase [bioreactor metagenome]|uniref:L-threonine kinase n=1 Tax=bioreactor metagenome TaxID=1076179 RepID=A0A645ACV5_9ZZZZ
MVTVKAPGSCGELVQGTINGANFLVTCPVNIYSEVAVIPAKQPSDKCDYDKVRTAVAKTLQYLNIKNIHFDFHISTQLPIGKGMASSSADISAACQAVAISQGKFLTPAEIADIALGIEPTDAIFYPGILMFDHVNGRIRHNLGAPPEIDIAVFDVGGEIDTLHFNQRNDLPALNRGKEEAVRMALDMVTKGLANGDINLIGQGTTLSAIANQSILFKPNLDGIINLSKQFNAAGVNVAHSGTVLGVLFARNSQWLLPCVSAICKNYPEAKYLKTVKIISGGLQLWEGDSNSWIECF